LLHRNQLGKVKDRDIPLTTTQPKPPQTLPSVHLLGSGTPMCAGCGGLEALLNEGLVVCHPFIVGELACGNLHNRSEILVHLQALPQAIPAEPDEVMQFIENHSLMGTGLGYIDLQLLASALLSKVALWTLDKRLPAAAVKIGLVSYSDNCNASSASRGSGITMK
jgi:hypothetical protein